MTRGSRLTVSDALSIIRSKNSIINRVSHMAANIECSAQYEHMLSASLVSLFSAATYQVASTLITWRKMALCSSVLSRGIKLRKRPGTSASDLNLTALFRC